MRQPSQRNRTNRHLINQIPCLKLFIRKMSPLKFSRLRRRSTGNPRPSLLHLSLSNDGCEVALKKESSRRFQSNFTQSLFQNVQIPIHINPFSLFYSKKFAPLSLTSTALVQRTFLIDMRLHITYPAIYYHYRL